MGASESNSYDTLVRPYTPELYFPVQSARMNNSMIQKCVQDHIISQTKLASSSFNCVWSQEFADSISPTPRTGQFTATDDENKICYIGYGLSKDGNERLNDVWALDMNTLIWRKINIKAHIKENRSGSKAVFYDNKIYVFGGFSTSKYLADLHVIDLNTGSVESIEAQGEGPCERTAPVITIHNGSLFVWGGFNGQWQHDLFELNLQTKVWQKYPQEITGKVSGSFVQIDHTVYTYGEVLICMDLEQKFARVLQTTGTEPVNKVLNAGSILIENRYMVFFGGRSTNQGALIYICDLDKLWWFLLPVLPDHETVSMSDGIVSNTGIFLVPRLHSFGFYYDEDRRSLVTFLGFPEKDPIPINVFHIEEALSIIHLREDMCEMTYF